MATQSIGIDIRAAGAPTGGKSHYCEQLTKALIQEAPPHIQFHLFTQNPNPDFPNSDRVKQIVIPGRGLLWHFKLKKFLHQHPVDWFLATTSTIYPAIAPRSQKVALVVHDLIAFLFAGSHALFPTLVEQLTLPRALKKAQLLITVSEHTHKDLINRFPKVKNLPHVVATPGVSSAFTPTPQKTLKLPDRYILAVGATPARKNLTRILQAFAQLADSQSDLHLVIAGNPGKPSIHPHQNRIHFLGYVPTQQLPELYTRAQLLAFPSLYEGFGMPIIEAMACGTPVITSTTSSLPEVAGDAALLIDPTDLPALTQAMKDLLSPQKHALYRQKGLKRAKTFTWQASARTLLTKLQ